MNKVFVYGTLKRNEPNHHWLTEPNNGVSKFLCVGKTQTQYPLIIATRYNVPFLLYSPGKGHNVEGEIYEVDDKMLAQLDILEDHPKFYVREIKSILTDKNTKPEIVQCWVYLLKDFKSTVLSMPFIACYSNNGSHGLKYIEKSARDPSYDHTLEVTEKKCKNTP